MHLNCSHCGASLVGQSPHEHNGRQFCDSVCVSLAYPEEYKTEDKAEDQQSEEDLIQHKFKRRKLSSSAAARSREDLSALIFLGSLPPDLQPSQCATSVKDEKPPIPTQVFFDDLKKMLEV